MTLADLDDYFRSFLEIGGMAAADMSLNGVQVGERSKPIDKIAFAVDASLETFRRAKKADADMLFVHHGIFWGKPEALSGNLYIRIGYLVRNELALYACHLPLDAHPEYGNNAVLARQLKMAQIRPFGLYHGQLIGFQGFFPEPISLEEAIRRVLPDGGQPVSVPPYGPEKIKRAAVISGGAGSEAMQAIAAGLDLYVTGEASHEIYHQAEEAGMSYVAAGHYATETGGVKALAAKVSAELGLETCFIDVPTGL
jgi:dinuclear metal center YbgI/SA1388 family protein